MGQTCTVGQGAMPEQTTVPRERNLSTMTIKDRKASATIETKTTTPSCASTPEQKSKILDTLPAKDIAESHKSYALCPFSFSDAIPSEQSMSTFDWAKGCGCDGLDVKKEKTREEIGIEALKAMVACGTDVNKLSTHGGRSALMFAVISQDLDFVKTLVASGANVREESEHGETALGLAKSLSTNDIYNFLLKSVS